MKNMNWLLFYLHSNLKHSIYQFQMMESAFYHMPSPSDSERIRNYLHRNPVQTPPHYPQVLSYIKLFFNLYSHQYFFILY